MTKYNTNNPIGSPSVKDVNDNSINFDHATNDRDSEHWTDRLGRERKTWHGIEKENERTLTEFKENSENAILSVGYAPIGSFQEGCSVKQINEVVLWKIPEGDGDYYRWDGDLEKIVPADSSPNSTGGTGKGRWINVGAATFRAAITGADGFKYIGACHSIDELRNMAPPTHQQRVLVNKYYSTEDIILPREYMWDAFSTENEDGGMVIQSAGSNNGRWLLQDVGSEIDVRLFGIMPSQDYSDDLVDYSASLIKAINAVGKTSVIHFPTPRGWGKAHYLVHTPANSDWSKSYISADAGVILHAANTNDNENEKPRLKTDVCFSQQVPRNPIDYGSERGSNDYDVKSAITSAMGVAGSLSTKTAPLDFTKAAMGIKYASLGPSSGITYTYDSTGTTITKDQVYFDANNQSTYCGVALAASVGSEIEVLVENTGSISAGVVVIGFKALGVNGGTSSTLSMHININTNEVDICNGMTVVSVFKAPFPTDVIKANTDNAVRVGGRIVTQGLVALTLNGRVVGTVSTSSVFAREFILLVDNEARKGIRFKYGFYRIRDKVNYTKPLSLACVGDSITRGARTSNEWPRLLEAYAEHLPGIGKIQHVTNFGISGRTLRGVVADIASLDFQGYDYTLVQLGTNDCQNKGNIGQFYNDVVTLGNKIVSDGSVPIFAVFPKFTSSELTGNGNKTNHSEFISKYQSVIRWAAESKGWKVVFVDDFFGDNCGMAGDYDNPLKISNSWCHDNIHPNSRGSIAVAAAFANALSSVLSFDSNHSMCERLTLTGTSQFSNEISRGIPQATRSQNTVTDTGAISSSVKNAVIARLPAFSTPRQTMFIFLPYSVSNEWKQVRVEIRQTGEIAVGSDYIANGVIELCVTYNV